VDSARVDQWLWGVRLYKTRTAATGACRAGHVRINGSPAKPSTRVRPGDRVEARLRGSERVVEVVEAITSRVGAARAAQCALDLSPAAPAGEDAVLPRERGAGRPTKRDRRRLDRVRR
jgi:ribosome-associated heat shock protein Hsp15